VWVGVFSQLNGPDKPGLSHIIDRKGVATLIAPQEVSGVYPRLS